MSRAIAISTPDKAQVAAAAFATDARVESPASTEQLYRFLVESSTQYAIFAISLDGTVVSWNAGAERVFGFTRAEIHGKNFDVVFSAEDRAQGAPLAELQTAEAVGRNDIDRWHIRKDGSRFWATNTVQPMRDEHGNTAGFTKIVRDATERYLATETLRQSRESYRILVETVREYAIFAVSAEGIVTLWNTGAQELFGYREDEIVGRHFDTLYTPDDRQSDVPRTEIHRAALHGAHEDERWLVRKDGSRFFASGRLTQIRGSGISEAESGFVKVAHDITERKKSEEALRHQALHDALTGLPNRALFIEHLKHAIACAKRHADSSFAVMFLDVDNFKLINDSVGHVIADGLLRALATRLHSICREENIIARIGGDEFSILVSDLRHPDDAQALVKRIRLALSVPFDIEGHETFVTVSIGITLGSAGYDEPEQALRDADIAMYAAKAQGRSNERVFEPAMHQQILAEQHLETHLRRGFERGEFKVVYQPIVELRTSGAVGFEALVRWQHPTRGLLQPSDFLPAARKTELIIAIDRWVLRTACLEGKMWHAAHPAAQQFVISVNLSSRQFERDDLVAYVAGVLRETGFDPSCLKLEITEDSLMVKSEAVMRILDELRGLGIELFVDDFGTGYSSLSYLGDLPVAMLKIDRSFVEKLGMQPSNDTIVASIIDLAHNLQFKAMAEGIETAEQLHVLKAFGCDFGQGYLFSRPVDWSVATALLEYPRLTSVANPH
ncbi:MAG: EAL domain-containing protein [Candidatus Velthaea sp.]